jgi:formylglycine-generating enzyme required for sulfatase activity
VYYTTVDYSTALRISSDAKDYIVEEAYMKPGANGYRLPTAAQWEYAGRGGGLPSATGSFAYKYAGTNDESELNNYAWHSGNASKSTHPVGEKLPNTLGLYDMTGNVLEWCWDKSANTVTGTFTDPTEGGATSTLQQRKALGSAYNIKASDSGWGFIILIGNTWGTNQGTSFRVSCR